MNFHENLTEHKNHIISIEVSQLVMNLKILWYLTPELNYIMYLRVLHALNRVMP